MTDAENVSDMVFGHAAARPEAAALRHGETVIAYGRFADLVARGAAWAERQGIAPGERVALALANGIDHFVLLFALFRAGAVPIEVPPYADAAYRRALAGTLGVTRAIAAAAAGPAQDIGVPTLVLPGGWRGSLAALPAGARRGGGGDLSTILLSSGSTGMPKGLLLPHAEQLRHHRTETVIAPRLAGDPPRPMIIPQSISYGGFFVSLLASVMCGAETVIAPPGADAAAIARLAAAHPGAVLPATPTLCRALAALAPPGARLLPQLSALLSMGQPLFAADKRAVTERVTTKLFDCYGAVGVGFVACLGPDEMATKAHTVGRPAAPAEIAVVDAAGRPVPAGTCGHVRARQPGQTPVFVGGTPAAGEAMPAGEWMPTGEIGRLDGDGYLELKGRTADIIRRDGIEIFPTEVEERLLAYRGVKDAALAAVPGPDAEIVLLALIVRSPSVTGAGLARYCETTLSPGKRPGEIVFVPALPYLETGKIDRMRVRRMARTWVARQPDSQTPPPAPGGAPPTPP